MSYSQLTRNQRTLQDRKWQGFSRKLRKSAGFLTYVIKIGSLVDMGALMKQAMVSPAISEHKKDAPKYAQKLAKAAHSLSAEALGLDEFETLSREKAYLALAMGVPVEIYSADEAGEGPKGKSRQAEPGRPAIYIE